MPMAALLLAAVFSTAASAKAPDLVVQLTTAAFETHLKENKHTLVEFYAPWCGHCKKLAPELEKAASALASRNIILGKVDATVEKDLSSKYKVKGYPTLVWFEDGKESEYDGGRSADAIVDWVKSMTGPAVSTEPVTAEHTGDKPRLVLHAPTLLQSFEDAAKASRRKASWQFVQGSSGEKIVLEHAGEEPIELTSGVRSKDSIISFLRDNLLPLFGRLDGDTFDKYMDAGQGLVWSLFKNQDGAYDPTSAKTRPMMSEVARKFRGQYFVTHTDTEQFKEAIDNMLGVTEFPAIAVQKKAGDKRKYVYTGAMEADKIIKFIKDVEAGAIKPKLKSEPVPTKVDDLVKVSVGTTMENDIFTADKDVLLEVYAPWCGHCKKLEPEYIKLAKKIKKEELTDLLSIAKIDGTANDSPVDSIDWTSFPTIYFVKAGTREPVLYDGERTAKGLWKYVKKHATKAQEIADRLQRRRGSQKRGEEL